MGRKSQRGPRMKIPKYDIFEKCLAATMVLITILGIYYAKTIYKLAGAQIYDPSIPTNVLLFLLVQTSILNGVLLYSLLKKRKKVDE